MWRLFLSLCLCAWVACMSELTNFQLSLNAVLAAVPVFGLRGVVLRHHLHKLAWQRGMLWDKGRHVEVSGMWKCNIATWMHSLTVGSSCRAEIKPCFCCSLRDYHACSVSGQKMALRRVFGKAAQWEGRGHRKCACLWTPWRSDWLLFCWILLADITSLHNIKTSTVFNISWALPIIHYSHMKDTLTLFMNILILFINLIFL